MNSENIFLSKQIEQVDITDPSIDQRGKTNKPSLQKPEGFLCSKFKDVSPAMQWQKGAQCRWQKGYAHHEGSWPWGREIASAPGQGTGHCLLPPGYSSSLVSKWHQITAWNVCKRLEPEQRIDWPAPARSCSQQFSNYSMRSSVFLTRAPYPCDLFQHAGNVPSHPSKSITHRVTSLLLLHASMEDSVSYSHMTKLGF